MSDLEWRLHHRDEEKRAEELRKKQLEEQERQAQFAQEESNRIKQRQELEQKELEKNNKILQRRKEIDVSFDGLLQQLQIEQKFDIFRKSLQGGPIIQNWNPPILPFFTDCFKHDTQPTNILGKSFHKLYASATKTRSGMRLLNKHSFVRNGDEVIEYDWSNKQELTDHLWTQIYPSYCEHDDMTHLNIELFYDYWQLRDTTFLFEPRRYARLYFGLLPIQESRIGETRREIDNIFVEGFDEFTEIDKSKDILQPLRHTLGV